MSSEGPQKGKRKVTFFDAAMRTVFRDSVHPLAMTEGEWKSLVNLRLTDRTMRARWGSFHLSSIVSGAVFRGGWVGKFQGVERIFLAVYVGGLADKVRVYMCVDGLNANGDPEPGTDSGGPSDPTVNANWVEITREFSGGAYDTGIGPYGLTRMTDSGPVWFELVQDIDNRLTTYTSANNSPGYSQDVLLFGNSANRPRAFGRFYGGNSSEEINGSGTNQCCVITQVDPDLKAGKKAVVATLLSNGWPMGDSGWFSTPGATGGMSIAMAASSVDSYATITANPATPVVAGNVCHLVADAGLSALYVYVGPGYSQIHIGIDVASVDQFLSRITIKVGNYSGGFTPVGTLANPVVSHLGGTVYLLSYDVTSLSTSDTACGAIQFYYNGTGESGSSYTPKVFLIANGPTADYATPGNTDYRLTRYNHGSHTESPPVQPMVSYEQQTGDIPGSCYLAGKTYAGYQIPVSDDLYYAYVVTFYNPTQALINVGVEGVRFYRKRPADDDFYAIEHFELASYSETYNPLTPLVPPSAPTWTFTSGTTTGAKRTTTMLSRESPTFTTPPHESNLAMPMCDWAAATNDRLFVGSNSYTDVPLPTDYNVSTKVLVSARDRPFRYTSVNLYDPATQEPYPDSPCALNIRGEDVVAGVQVSGSAAGLLPRTAVASSAMYLFGEKWVYVTGGKTTGEILQVSNIGLPGTISPYSIAKNNNRIYYLDNRGQVSAIEGGSGGPISRNKVDDITKAIPVAMKPYVSGECCNDRYYMSYAVSGGTRNTKVLVYSEEIEDFESNDTPRYGIDGLLTWTDPTDKVAKLFAYSTVTGVSDTIHAFTYDDSSATSGDQNFGETSFQDITVSGQSYEYHDSEFNPVMVHRISTVAVAGDAGDALTYTVNYIESGGVRPSTVDLEEATGGYVRTYDTLGSQTDPREGGSFNLSFSGSVPPGYRLLNITAEVEVRTKPPRREDA